MKIRFIFRCFCLLLKAFLFPIVPTKSFNEEQRQSLHTHAVRWRAERCVPYTHHTVCSTLYSTPFSVHWQAGRQARECVKSTWFKSRSVQVETESRLSDCEEQPNCLWSNYKTGYAHKYSFAGNPTTHGKQCAVGGDAECGA